MNAQDLIGTWRFPRAEDPSGVAFLHFTSTQAFDYLADGEVRQLMRLWYVLEPPNLIRFRNHLQEAGWTCRIVLAEEKLILIGDGGQTICERARPEEIPEWFPKEIAG